VDQKFSKISEFFFTAETYLGTLVQASITMKFKVDPKFQNFCEFLEFFFTAETYLGTFVQASKRE